MLFLTLNNDHKITLILFFVNLLLEVISQHNDAYLMVSTVDPANDSDIDGMDDSWESDNFGDYSRDGSGDDDQDGYTNFYEYVNFSLGLDSNGIAFDPFTKNAADGIGYNDEGLEKKNIWILFLPAILSSAQ